MAMMLPVQDFMSAVEMEMTARLAKPEEAAKFSRQHLANSLWALATLERQPPPSPALGRG